MARLILLDSSPLGLIVRAPSPSKPQVGQCLAWVQAMFASGAAVVVPEITHYEVRRELLRIRAVGSLRRLDFALDRRSGFRHLALSTDAILAGQAALAGQPGDTVTIATTNLTHLSRFPGIDAQAWDQIQ
jgi:hypothetical protein